MLINGSDPGCFFISGFYIMLLQLFISSTKSLISVLEISQDLPYVEHDGNPCKSNRVAHKSVCQSV